MLTQGFTAEIKEVVTETSCQAQADSSPRQAGTSFIGPGS